MPLVTRLQTLQNKQKLRWELNNNLMYIYANLKVMLQKYKVSAGIDAFCIWVLPYY